MRIFHPCLVMLMRGTVLLKHFSLDTITIDNKNDEFKKRKINNSLIFELQWEAICSGTWFLFAYFIVWNDCSVYCNWCQLGGFVYFLFSPVIHFEISHSINWLMQTLLKIVQYFKVILHYYTAIKNCKNIVVEEVHVVHVYWKGRKFKL